MNEHEVIEDANNNPFIAQARIRTWNTDEVAPAQVHDHLRCAIARLQFYLRHPLINDPPDEAHITHLEQELVRFKDLLNKAHYN